MLERFDQISRRKNLQFLVQLFLAPSWEFAASFQLMGDSNNDKKFKIKSYNLNNYLKLDSGAFKSLNLLPTQGSSSRTHSVYGVLNKCCTAQGQRLLTQWIKQPLLDVHRISMCQSVVVFFVALILPVCFLLQGKDKTLWRFWSTTPSCVKRWRKTTWSECRISRKSSGDSSRTKPLSKWGSEFERIGLESPNSERCFFRFLS